MSKKVIVFAPFEQDFDPTCGTTIRIAGYTKGIRKHQIDFLFFSSVKPDYILTEEFVQCSINRKWIKFFLLHNVFKNIILFKPIALLLNLILTRYSGIDKVIKTLNGRLIWTHQENVLAFYLYLKQKQEFIYDIHGFFDIQREYKYDLSLWRRFWFDLYTLHEKFVLNQAPFLNVVSTQMKRYVEKVFFPKGQIQIAPDGIPDELHIYTETQPNEEFRKINAISAEHKIILYAGSFKKIGGVTELVKLYVDEPVIHTDSVLVLIGSGQEENNVQQLLRKSNVQHKVFSIKSLAHKELIAFMKMADVIVCPDIYGNTYNEITPHIKLYDAIASGKNVVATDFEVNKELFPEHEFNIFYFSYLIENSFKESLCNALSKMPMNNSKDITHLTYTIRAKSFCETYLNSNERN